MSTKSLRHDVLVEPGKGLGLIGVIKQRYLLSLLVRKEVQIRYRGSVLGWLWSYVKPLVQFVVYFVALGVFLQLNKTIEFYPIYLLAGMTAIVFFTEAFSNGTRSIVENAPLIKKIYLPREMFPVASMLVAVVNVGPQLIVIAAIALFFGWVPSLMGLLAIILAIVIVAVFATGLALLFGAINVSYRDAESFVELIVMCAMWASPVMYQWQMVRHPLGELGFFLYQLNPLTVSVELLHSAFWQPLARTTAEQVPGLVGFTAIALVVSFITLFVGQLVFKSLEGRFAQEL